MNTLLSGIAQNRFLVVGRVGMDVFTDPGAALETSQRMSLDIGGSAANTAVGICKLGGAASLVTCVSDDAVGATCLERLAGYGVGTSAIRKVQGEYRTSLAVYESVLEGHRNVIYRNGAADFQMNADDINALDLSRFGAMITAGTVFAAEPSRSAAFLALERANAANMPVIFDVDYRPYSWPSAQEASDVLTQAAEQSDMIVGNDEEFGFVAGSYDQGLAKARALAQEFGKLVIYKRGPEGAITFWQGAEIRTGIFNVDALKPVGAGDSFMAGLMTALAGGYALKEAILRASACASITVTRPGCAPALPTGEDLEAFLHTHRGPTQP